MANATGILDTLRSQIDTTDYRKIHWEGTFDEYLDIVAREPRGHAHRLPAPLRHDPVARHRGGLREQGEAHALQVLHRVRRQARRRHLRPRPHRSCSWSTPSSRPPRATAPNAACCCCTARSARPRAPSPACSSAAWRNTRRTDAGMLFSLLLEERRRHLAQGPDARRAAATHPAGTPRRPSSASSTRAARSRRITTSGSRATCARSAGYDVQRTARQVRRRLARRCSTTRSRSTA